jgi:hypothetical protein
MRNSISKSIVAGGAGDVDGRNLGVRAMGWRWLSPGLFDPPSALDLSVFTEASVREGALPGTVTWT